MEVIYIFVVAFFIWLIFKPKSDVGKVRVNTKYNKKEAGPRKETVTVLRSSSAEKKSDEQNKVDTGACDENDKENIQLTRNNLSRISSKKKASIDSAKNSDKAKIAEEKEIDVRDNPIQAPNSSTTTKTASNYLTSQLASQPQLTSTSRIEHASSSSSADDGLASFNIYESAQTHSDFTKVGKKGAWIGKYQEVKVHDRLLRGFLYVGEQLESLRGFKPVE